MNGCIFMPAAELIKMIDPPRPPSMIFCAPAITVFHVPVTFTSITSRNDSGVISFQAGGAVMPAPSRALRTAWARPWPRAAPVMNATLSVNRPVMCAPYRKGHCNGDDITSLLALCRLDQVRTDDQPLNLAGSLVQSQQADVAVDTFDRHLAHVSAATVNLHGEVGDFAGHLGAEHLRR